MEDDRLNSPNTSAVTIEVLGHHLHISQDPNSKHLGTTVWDASMVFIKFLEKNCRKGRFCRSKLKGKRVIELGAGCGLAGFDSPESSPRAASQESESLGPFTKKSRNRKSQESVPKPIPEISDSRLFEKLESEIGIGSKQGMALLGCDVVSTDQIDVLPLLMRNVERNTSRIMQANPDTESFGSIEVAELVWGNQDHIVAVNPPFDYIIGTDIVYAEHLLEPLLQTIFALSGPRTIILLGYEIRSTAVHERMIHMLKINFEVKTVSKAKMDSKYQHPSIRLFMMSLKAQPRSEENTSSACEIAESKYESDEADGESCGLREWGDNNGVEEVVNGKVGLEVESRKLDDWEIRRYGSMAARFFRDVKIT